MKDSLEMEGTLRQMLQNGIMVESSSEAVSVSRIYTDVSSRLSKAQTLITLIKSSSIPTINSGIINIFLDGLKFLTNKINVVGLIRSWEEAERNLLPTRINQYNDISDKLVRLKRLSLIFIVGRFYRQALHRADEQLRSSIENISYTSRCFHTRGSNLSIEIYQDYDLYLQATVVKTTKLRTKYEQASEQLRSEQRNFNNLLKAAEPLLNETKALQDKFKSITQQVVYCNNSLNLEGVNQVCKILNDMRSFAEARIQEVEKRLVPSFQTALTSICKKVLSIQKEYIQLEQSALSKAKSLNEQSRNIVAEVKEKDERLTGGRQKWEMLRKKKAVPYSLEVTIPNAELLSLTRSQWLSSVGGELRARRLRTEIQILKDWIAQIGTDNTEISNELYALFFRCANIIGATCIHAGNKRRFLSDFSEFDVVIIDEVSKATPTELLVPCLLGKKIVLVGDHKQLPPIFGEESCFTEAAESLGLDVEELRKELSTCLFKERYEYLDSIGASRTLMLTQQYRMHSQIMSAINQFYEGKLSIGYEKQDSDRAHGIEISNWLSKEHHLVWIDLPHSSRRWHHQQAGTGRQNQSEAELIISILNDILKSLHKRQNIS